MNAIQTLLTENIGIWSAADTEKKSGRGRSAGNTVSVYGIKKLRELILELAVRGKLVPQDQNDEPAHELLKRIQAEKAKQIAEGKIKKDKPLIAIAEDEEPFDPPYGWEWVRLGEIAEAIRGVTYGKSDASDNPLPDYVPLLRGNNINRVLNFDSPVFVPKRLLNEAQYVKAGDIVIAMSSGSADLVGKAAQASEDFIGGFGAFCGVIRSVSDEVSNYFGFFFQTPLYRNRAAGHGKGIGINNLQKTALQSLEIPIPPLAEQHRILAKVDELMTLCDQLEAQHSNSAEAHEKLVSHVLGTLTQSQNPEDFSANWQRIAVHFDTLFTTEASIDALKQTLLQLAVMGKLVRQDPNDIPARELINRIQAAKTKLIAEGKIKKDKALPPITDDEKPYVLPQGWEWVMLFEVTTGMDSGWSPACLETSSPSDTVWGVLKTTSVQVMHYLEQENKELPEKLVPRPEAEVKAGDILFTRAGPTNRVAISCLVHSTRPRLMISDKIIRFHPVEVGIDGRFMTLCLNTGATAAYLEKAKSGMAASQVNISQEKLRLAPIPMPPLTEQRRIGAKLEELMALCEQLKTRITQANQLQQKLADVVVEQAVA